MEFFREVNVLIFEEKLKEDITLGNLSALTDDIFIIGNQLDNSAEIGGMWGEFTLTRQEIRGGIRLSLVECPNALTWTITTDLNPNKNVIVLHLTINRKEHNEDFIEEINEFLDNQVDNLTNYFS